MLHKYYNFIHLIYLLVYFFSIYNFIYFFVIFIYLFFFFFDDHEGTCLVFWIRWPSQIIKPHARTTHSFGPVGPHHWPSKSTFRIFTKAVLNLIWIRDVVWVMIASDHKSQVYFYLYFSNYSAATQCRNLRWNGGTGKMIVRGDLRKESLQQTKI